MKAAQIVRAALEAPPGMLLAVDANGPFTIRESQFHNGPDVVAYQQNELADLIRAFFGPDIFEYPEADEALKEFFLSDSSARIAERRRRGISWDRVPRTGGRS